MKARNKIDNRVYAGSLLPKLPHSVSNMVYIHSEENQAEYLHYFERHKNLPRDRRS